MYLNLKPKPIFYCYGNDRRFADDCLIAKMTGEPLPKKWQEFFELPPEQKAQWDADLRLDAEYRIAEAQGFPNGIPGGKERGNVFYFLAQRAKEYKRECEEVQAEYAENQAKHFSLRKRTGMQGGRKWVMEYNPYGAPPNYEPPEPPILPQETFPMAKIELPWNVGVPNHTSNNAAARPTPNVSAATSWGQFMNQPTYNFSRNILDDYGQNGDKTNDWYTQNHTADSSTYNDGLSKEEYVDQNSTGWNFMRDNRMGEVFVSRQGAEAVLQTAQSVYDALQEYGISVLSVAGNFATEWGVAYAETLLKKAPFPQVRAVAVALFLAKKVYDVAKGVADKRKDKINELTAGDSSPEVVAAAATKADEMIGIWLVEEIEKVVIEEGLDTVLDQIPGMYSRDKAKDAIITAWNTFIKNAESGRWERGVIR